MKKRQKMASDALKASEDANTQADAFKRQQMEPPTSIKLGLMLMANKKEPSCFAVGGGDKGGGKDDGKGKRVPKSEFRKSLREYGLKAREAEIDQLFVVWDSGNNGSIEIKELRERAKEVKEEAANRSFDMERCARACLPLHTVTYRDIPFDMERCAALPGGGPEHETGGAQAAPSRQRRRARVPHGPSTAVLRSMRPAHRLPHALQV